MKPVTPARIAKTVADLNDMISDVFDRVDEALNDAACVLVDELLDAVGHEEGAHLLARAGMTAKDIADFIDINEKTIAGWLDEKVATP